MKFLERIAKRFGFVRSLPAPTRPVMQRNYSAADFSRLTADWIAGSSDASAELRCAVRPLRNRSRAAERNDDYMRRYLGLVENNVLGSCGIRLQNKARKANGQPDKVANDAIEDAWRKWGKKRNCCVNRMHTWRGLCRLVLRAVKRDGGVFLRKWKGFDNEFRYALQAIEIDHLDLDYVATLPNGNRIDGGVELNPFGEAVAFYLWRQHPGASMPTIRNNRRDRIPADEIIHAFLPDRIAQVIGAPACSSALLRMKMLAGYEEAELIAAREAACKGYGIKQQTPDSYSGASEDSQGRQLQPVEPGMGLLLQPGEEYFAINPDHPTSAFPDFTKSIVRGIASGLGVSYNSLANDLEDVNYSSIRAGLLEEREEWKAVQEWFIEEICEPIFEDWLAWSLGFGFIKSGGGSLGLAHFDYYNQAEWKPRRWPWVDPQKDVEAHRAAVALRFKSRRSIISEEGGDIDEVDADFDSDPYTKDLDVASAYVPDRVPDPSELPDNGESVRVKFGPLTNGVSLNGKNH
jgi:lambda family phage portal protein